MEENKHHILKSYSLRGKRDFTENDKAMLESLKHFDSTKYSKEVILEIGSGDGKVITKIASNNPQKQFISCEVFVSGIIKIIKSITQNNLLNLDIYREDARFLLEKFNDGHISQLWLLYPDPWPKKRHHKRRIVNQHFLDLIYKKLNNTGKFIFATDHYDYYEFFLEIIKHNKQKFDIQQTYLFNVAQNSITPQDGLDTKDISFELELINTIFSSKYATKNLAQTEVHYAVIVEKNKLYI